VSHSYLAVKKEEIIPKTDANFHNEAVANALGCKSVLTKELEDSLFSYCKDMDVGCRCMTLG
jgi:glutaminase